MLQNNCQHISFGISSYFVISFVCTKFIPPKRFHFNKYKYNLDLFAAQITDKRNMGRSKNSIVWRNYTKKGNGVDCNFCKKSYRFANVSKMKKHSISCLHTPDTVKIRLNSEAHEKDIAPLSTAFEAEIDNNSSASSTMPKSPASTASTAASSSRPSTPASRSSALFFDKMTDQENVSITKSPKISIFVH